MLRKLATVLLATLCACTPLQPTPPAPTASVTVVTGAPVPTITLVLTASAVPPTPEPPVRQFHPLPRALGSINVLEAVCASRATTWFVYEYGMTQVYDADADARCRERGTV